MFDPNDGPILMRAILEDPDDDQPRRNYADWLMDRAEPGDEERAEFILIQCEIAEIQKHHNGPCAARRVTQDGIRLLWRERELFEKFKCGWFGGDSWAIYYLGHESEDADQYPDLTSAFISRGFVSEVRLTCEKFMRLGEACPRYHKGKPPLYDVASETDCTDCHGTGQLPGVAETLFKSHPVTKVVLTDLAPDVKYENRLAEWFKDRGRRRYLEGGYRCFVPDEIFDRLTGKMVRTGIFFGMEGWCCQYSEMSGSDAVANKDISHACVAHGRSLAGLPTMPDN